MSNPQSPESTASGATTTGGKPPSRGDGSGLRALKVLVIGMGVLLVIGMLGFVAALVMKLGGDDGARAPAIPADERQAVLRLGLPDGSAVRGMTGLPAGGGLAVHVAMPDGSEAIYVVPLDGRGRILRIAVTGGTGSDGREGEKP